MKGYGPKPAESKPPTERSLSKENSVKSLELAKEEQETHQDPKSPMTLFIDFKENDQQIPKRELTQTSPVSLQIMSDPLKQKLKKFGETMKVDASIQFSDSHEGEKKQYNILTRV